MSSGQGEPNQSNGRITIAVLRAEFEATRDLMALRLDQQAALFSERLDAMERRQAERFATMERAYEKSLAEVKEKADDKERRLRVLEAQRSRGAWADIGSYFVAIGAGIAATLAGLIGR